MRNKMISDSVCSWPTLGSAVLLARRSYIEIHGGQEGSTNLARRTDGVLAEEKAGSGGASLPTLLQFEVFFH